MQQRQQIISGSIKSLCAQVIQLTGGRHQGQFTDVMHRQTVLQAMYATGVFSHIAPDGTGDLRRRVWCIEQPKGPDMVGNGQISHAGLNPRQQVRLVHFKNPVQSRQAQQDTVIVRHGTTRQTRASPPRHHRNTVGMTQSHHGLHLGYVSGQQHQPRQLLFSGQTI